MERPSFLCGCQWERERIGTLWHGCFAVEWAAPPERRHNKENRRTTKTRVVILGQLPGFKVAIEQKVGEHIWLKGKNKNQTQSLPCQLSASLNALFEGRVCLLEYILPTSPKQNKDPTTLASDSVSLGPGHPRFG